MGLFLVPRSTNIGDIICGIDQSDPKILFFLRSGFAREIIIVGGPVMSYYIDLKKLQQSLILQIQRAFR